MPRKLSQTENAAKCRERYARKKTDPEFLAKKREQGRAWMAAWRAEHPDVSRIKQIEQRARDSESPDFRVRKAAYARAWRARRVGMNAHGTAHSYHANRHLKATYGVTLAQRSEMIAKQGGCALCHRTEARWHIDHDHATGEVRGVLCHACNVALGGYEKIKAQFPNVESYLSGWPVGDDMSALRAG